MNLFDNKKEKATGIFRLPFIKKEESKDSSQPKEPSVAEQGSDITVEEKPKEDKKIPRYVYKPLVDEKLTILLIENTHEVAKQCHMIIKILKRIVNEGKVCIINYGTTVKQSEIMPVYQLQTKEFFADEDLGENACLFEALIALKVLVACKLLSIEEGIIERTRISDIQIIGIGTGKEQGSKVSKDSALQAFAGVAKKPRVVTKYFCLTEESFLQVAEIGFHSIGSIDRTY